MAGVNARGALRGLPPAGIVPTTLGKRVRSRRTLSRAELLRRKKVRFGRSEEREGDLRASEVDFLTSESAPSGDESSEDAGTVEPAVDHGPANGLKADMPVPTSLPPLRPGLAVTQDLYSQLAMASDGTSELSPPPPAAELNIDSFRNAASAWNFRPQASIANTPVSIPTPTPGNIASHPQVTRGVYGFVAKSAQEQDCTSPRWTNHMQSGRDPGAPPEDTSKTPQSDPSAKAPAGEETRGQIKPSTMQGDEFLDGVQVLYASIIVGYDNTRRELDATKGKLDATKDILDATKGKLDAMEGELDAKKGELDAMQREFDAMKLELETSGQRLIECQTRNSAFQKENAALGKRCEDLENEGRRSGEENAALRKRCEDLESEGRRSGEEAEAVKTRLSKALDGKALAEKRHALTVAAHVDELRLSDARGVAKAKELQKRIGELEADASRHRTDAARHEADAARREEELARCQAELRTAKELEERNRTERQNHDISCDLTKRQQAEEVSKLRPQPEKGRETGIRLRSSLTAREERINELSTTSAAQSAAQAEAATTSEKQLRRNGLREEERAALISGLVTEPDNATRALGESLQAVAELSARLGEHDGSELKGEGPQEDREWLARELRNTEGLGEVPGRLDANETRRMAAADELVTGTQTLTRDREAYQDGGSEGEIRLSMALTLELNEQKQRTALLEEMVACAERYQEGQEACLKQHRDLTRTVVATHHSTMAGAQEMLRQRGRATEMWNAFKPTLEKLLIDLAGQQDKVQRLEQRLGHHADKDAHCRRLANSFDRMTRGVAQTKPWTPGSHAHKDFLAELERYRVAFTELGRRLPPPN